MNIVEHVSKSVEGAIKADASDVGAYIADGSDEFPLFIEGDLSPSIIARAAIIATLQYARDNPTDRMLTAMRLANMNVAGGYGCPSGWEAAIDALLQEIGGGE